MKKILSLAFLLTSAAYAQNQPAAPAAKEAPVSSPQSAGFDTHLFGTSKPVDTSKPPVGSSSDTNDIDRRVKAAPKQDPVEGQNYHCGAQGGCPK